MSSRSIICDVVDHLTEAIVSLHWLRIPEWVVYKIAVLTLEVLNRSAAEYLGPFVRVTDLPRQSTRGSANTNLHPVPGTFIQVVDYWPTSISGWQSSNMEPPAGKHHLDAVNFLSETKNVTSQLIILPPQHTIISVVNLAVICLLKPFTKLLIQHNRSSLSWRGVDKRNRHSNHAYRMCTAVTDYACNKGRLTMRAFDAHTLWNPW